MIKRIYALMLISLLVAACSKSEPYTPTIDGSSSDEISFGLSDIWTKGDNISSLNEITALEVYSYLIEDGTAWDNISQAGTLKSFFTSDINSSFTLDVAADGSGSYIDEVGGTLYWPKVSSTLSFLTFYPEGELTKSANATTGKPELYYSQSIYAGDNDDIVYAALIDKTADDVTDGVVNLNLQHILSKLTIKAKLVGACTEDENYQNVSYTVNGVTISGLYGNADLIINSDGTTTWQNDSQKSTIDMTATQGITFLGIDDDGANLLLTANADEDGYIDVMNRAKAADIQNGIEATKDQGIYVIPQEIATKRGEDAPTISVRIRKSFDSTVDIDGVDKVVNTEVIYESAEIEIPAVVGDSESSWKAGTHYALLFDFDLSALDEYDTPLTLKSVIYDWSTATVDVDIQPNLYFYADDELIEAGIDDEYAEFCIYTNYEYDLRRHKRKYELDGINYTEANGFTYYLTNASWADSGTPLDPILLWDEDNVDFTNQENHLYSSLKEYTYSYDADGKLYVGGTADAQRIYQSGGVEVPINSDGYMDPSIFEDNDGWMYFVLKPNPSDSYTDFYYKVKKSDRQSEGLYVNSSVVESGSYGINKEADDAVYILRLNIDPDHLMKVDGTTAAETGDQYGYFYGKVGVEAISNGGGLFNSKFKMQLKKTLNN